MHDRLQHGRGGLDLRPDARPRVGGAFGRGFRTRSFRIRVGGTVGRTVGIRRAVRDAGCLGVGGRIGVGTGAVRVARRVAGAGRVRIAGTVELVGRFAPGEFGWIRPAGVLRTAQIIVG